MTAERTVAVVGAGPVGLLFALCAIEEGLRPIVLEKRVDGRRGSRAIGVHPPALAILERLGLGERFLSRGIPVRRGLAFGRRDGLGAVGFDRIPGQHPYVLAIPQEETESILLEALAERRPDALREGFELTQVRDGELELRDAAGRPQTLAADAVVACDGKHSVARSRCGIDVSGGAYDGLFAMADFPDTTRFRTDAAVFLNPAGLVESFPLPGGLRRWVVRRFDGAAGEPTADEIAATIWMRTGFRVPADEARGVSGFVAEHWLAARLSHGTVALAGDAAHVVSPIGGQGMNLGWLGAADLARTLGPVLRAGGDPTDALAANASRRRSIARVAARRSELNMWLGRPTKHPQRRDRLVRALLAGPCRNVLARSFTMHNLELGV